MLLFWSRSTVTYGILLRRLMSREDLMKGLVLFYGGQEEVFYLGDLLLRCFFLLGLLLPRLLFLSLLGFLPDPDM